MHARAVWGRFAMAKPEESIGRGGKSMTDAGSSAEGGILLPLDFR